MHFFQLFETDFMNIPRVFIIGAITLKTIKSRLKWKLGESFLPFSLTIEIVTTMQKDTFLNLLLDPFWIPFRSLLDLLLDTLLDPLFVYLHIHI